MGIRVQVTGNIDEGTRHVHLVRDSKIRLETIVWSAGSNKANCALDTRPLSTFIGVVGSSLAKLKSRYSMAERTVGGTVLQKDSDD